MTLSVKGSVSFSSFYKRKENGNVMEKCILNPERDCLGLIEARRLQKELEKHESETGNSLTKQGERIGSLETRMAVNETNYLNIIAKLDDLITKVASIEAKPAKRWEKVTGQVISVLVAAVLGFFLAKFGMTI